MLVTLVVISFQFSFLNFLTENMYLSDQENKAIS